MAATVQAKLLRRAKSDEEHAVYQAALEWDLQDPIVIKSREDVKSANSWRDRLAPYNHQVSNLITFCRRLPVSLLADDVGLGKTISAGLVMAELTARSRLRKTLIVCPKLLGPQWQEELQSKFGIDSRIAIGKDLKENDLSESGATITTYQTARLYLDDLPIDRFEMLILDEAHKLRNLYGVEKPPQVAVKFKKALQDRRFQFVLMLTATPIHNRLWDIYSLVDLLTVARGHKNPFGSEGMFARRYIADDRATARHLKPEARDEFRNIVYGYMSRVRRADAKLSFPERVVLMHKADPSPAERKLISIVGKYIEKMNRLAQISILQALASSPDALRAQLNNMARNGTVPPDCAAEVDGVVRTMPTSSKITALAQLSQQLAQHNPATWRMVIFTGRIETQTTIQAHLERLGCSVGLISGSTTGKNKDTLERFRRNPPGLHVIVSTEAGSEGINLQVANIVVNFDLPWNPMIVEQRIGRVQRLASEHATVSIYNVMLRGTFEEYIVGRLTEKLQMAVQAIGDVESLLEATGIDEDDETGGSFEEKIRQLVVASLRGKDVETATRQAEESIQQAKATLEREKEQIDQMLGGMDGSGYVGPRPPNLAPHSPSFDAKTFVLRAFPVLGATVTAEDSDIYAVTSEEGTEYVRFSDSVPIDLGTVSYAAHSPYFDRLVQRILASGVHSVVDADSNAGGHAAGMARAWVSAFKGSVSATKLAGIERCLDGEAYLRVRATVAHDSYERLLRVPCDSGEHKVPSDKDGLGAMSPIIDNPQKIGLKSELLSVAADLDPSISEFTRFYRERRAQELAAAGDDERKRKRLEDEFTPQMEISLVGLKGRMHRKLRVKVEYTFDDSQHVYNDVIGIVPSSHSLSNVPELQVCSQSGRRVPATCLDTCTVSGARALRHLLVRTEKSGRLVLPGFAAKCSLSGRTLCNDEVDRSSVSGRLVDRSLLKTSPLSGKVAEPRYFGRCAFTNTEALQSELLVSEISAKQYRGDEQMRSVVSGKSGHRAEFTRCAETGAWLLPSEAQVCSVTGVRVAPGVLEECEVSGKRAIPSQLERCALTGKRALKSLLAVSSISGSRLLESAAIKSSTGKACVPEEAVICAWGGSRCHPDDIRECHLTGLPVHFRFASEATPSSLIPLAELLDGSKLVASRTDTWALIAQSLSALVKGKIRVCAATQSPKRTRLAVVAESKELLGIRRTSIGVVFDTEQNAIVGAIALGRRSSQGWEPTRRYP